MAILRYKKLEVSEEEPSGSKEFPIEVIEEDEEQVIIRVDDPQLALWIINTWQAEILSLR